MLPDLLASILAHKPIHVRRLREVLSPAEVVRAMQEAGARPGQPATWWTAAAAVAPEVDDLIDPGALPDLPGMADDIAALVIEALDGPAAIIALRTIYARAVRQGTARPPAVIEPERTRLPAGAVRERIRSRLTRRRVPDIDVAGAVESARIAIEDAPAVVGPSVPDIPTDGASS